MHSIAILKVDILNGIGLCTKVFMKMTPGGDLNPDHKIQEHIDPNHCATPSHY